MAPTIQNGTTTERVKKDLQTTDKKSELLSKVKYCNTLPDFPFDTKFIRYPFSALRFVEYKPTTLERDYKYDLLTESDLGIEIDLVNRDIFLPDLNAQLDPADEKLLEEDILTPQDSKRSKHHARSVSWLRRTEYISTEQTRFQPQTMDKVEAKVGYNIKKTLTEGILYMDRVSQIEAIKKTFEDSKKPIEKHHSKLNVVPIEILPVFPDFSLWKYPCAQVIFDSDPAPVGRPVPAQIEEMSQAMIRGVMDESGEQFVAYFLPTQETLEKRRKDVEAGLNYVDDEEYDYKISREYNWNVKSKTSKGYEENYFLVMREDGIYYNELETRVRLNKRRQNYGQSPNNTRLVVKHRPLTCNESKMHRYREKQLEPQGYDEDSDQEEEQLQPQIQQNVEKAGSDDDVVTSRASSVESRRKSRSRSPSRAKSKSRSRLKSKSRSRSKSKSRSRSASKSTSRSKSRSLSPRSQSGSKSRSRSVSAESKTSSLSGSRSRSSSTSISKSPLRSHSKSRSVSKSKTPSRSGSGTENETDSGSNQSSSDTE